MKILNSIMAFLLPFKATLIWGGVALGLLAVTGLYANKKYKEWQYKKGIKKDEVSFEECVKKANTEGEMQLCFVKN